MCRWNTFRSLCNHNKRLNLALQMTEDVPSAVEINRWLAEPVKCLVIPTSLFHTNSEGDLVLGNPLQTVVQAFAGKDVRVLFSGPYNQDSERLNEHINYLWRVILLYHILLFSTRAISKVKSVSNKIAIYLCSEGAK